MTAPALSARELAARLAACRADWLPRYAPNGKIEGGVFYLGNAEGDPGRSLPIKLKSNGKPLVDFAAGPVGDDLDLMGRLIGGTPADAFKEAKGYLGLDGTTPTPWPKPSPMPRAEPTPASGPGPGLPAALKLYAEAKPILPHTTGARYLEARGCALPHLDGDLRQLDRCRHPVEGYTGPALIGLVTNAVTNAPMSVHFTWIRADGTKAKLERPRWVRKDLKIRGGVVRLWPDDCVTYGLLIAEGIETALTAARGFQPVWACLTAGNMDAFPVLDGIDCLTVVVDHDTPDERTGRQPGIEAGRACLARWLAAGRAARPYLPEILGNDMNDEVAQ